MSSVLEKGNIRWGDGLEEEANGFVIHQILEVLFRSTVENPVNRTFESTSTTHQLQKRPLK